MAVRLIAVDMDGSFLDDQMRYNRPRFARLHQLMVKRGVRFVVASGNQYFQLRSFFADYDDIIYVAENGAYVTDSTTEYFVSAFTAPQVAATLEQLGRVPEVEAVVCGKRSAYALNSAGAEFLSVMGNYYHRLELVSSLDHIDDQILKFALATPNSLTLSILGVLRQGLAGVAVPVSSGHGSIDLIQPGVHKGSALTRLGTALGIDPGDMIAFGDGGNDIEMLQLVGCGVAMANAPDHIKAHADAVTGSNNDEGVLEFIERALATTGNPA